MWSSNVEAMTRDDFFFLPTPDAHCYDFELEKTEGVRIRLEKN